MNAASSRCSTYSTKVNSSGAASCTCQVAVAGPSQLQGREEALGHGVVPAVALAAHALRRAGLGEQLAEARGGELEAAVGVEDQSAAREASRPRQRLEDQPDRSRASDQPTTLRENRSRMTTRKRNPGTGR